MKSREVRGGGVGRDAARGACMVLALVALLTLGGALARAEVAQEGTLRVAFEGRLTPRALPRAGFAPVAVTVGGTVSTTNDRPPPQLRRITIAINGSGRLDSRGLSVCTETEIQPSTTANALAACGPSKVGEGSFNANVAISNQAPFPAEGKLIAFNGVENGKPVILAHVYGTNPVPTSYTLPLRITHARGTFGTVLTGILPAVTSKVGFITGISMTLKRQFSYRGKPRSFLSAGCPAPKGFPGAVFPLARASFAFSTRTLTSTLTRSCRAKG
jgi:hypothetical protein